MYTVYIWYCLAGNSPKYMVIYGAYELFRPTLHVHRAYALMYASDQPYTWCYRGHLDLYGSLSDPCQCVWCLYSMVGSLINVGTGFSLPAWFFLGCTAYLQWFFVSAFVQLWEFLVVQTAGSFDTSRTVVKIWVPDSHSWSSRCLEELTMFGGAHDVWRTMFTMFGAHDVWSSHKKQESRLSDQQCYRAFLLHHSQQPCTTSPLAYMDTNNATRQVISPQKCCIGKGLQIAPFTAIKHHRIHYTHGHANHI
jgi:hypothetical protein